MQSFTIEEFKKIHQAWKESGLSVRDYCANTGIKESRYMIDYNPIENCVRPLSIGRKNYMFCGNHDAAEEAAFMYTMMGCCKLAGVDFRKWTTYFLTHIHEYDNDYSKDLADFLPLRLREMGIL